MTDLPAVRLKDLLRYCLDTGRLFWLERHEGDFSHCKNPQGQASAWNAKYAEREAFTATDGQGYKSGAIFGKTYTAHRVIWALVSGEWPDQEIDHADKVRTNNRWNNLRLASHGENARNRDVQANNSSGYKGVSLDKRRNKWRAVIDVDGAQKHLGYFPSAREARDAYARASVEYHGAFGRHNILSTLEPVAQPETPTPGQFTTMCLAIEDVVTGRGFDVDPWRSVQDDPPPYETQVLTYWPGNKMRNPVHKLDRLNSGTMLGKRDGWWCAVPGQEPTHWQPLTKPGETTSAIPEVVKAYMRNVLMVGGWRGERE